MKKRILFTIMVFTSMFFGVPNVFASTTITQADFDAAKGGTPTNGVSYIESGGHKWYNLTTDEEFIFDSDINLGDAFLNSDNNTINLNGHSITNDEVGGEDILLNAYDRNLTITGTGTVSRDVAVGGNGTLTLNGDVIYNGTVNISDENSKAVAVINAGTFNNSFFAAKATVTINDGTFTGSFWGGALNLSGVTATIKGGTFSAGAASAAYFDGSDVTITGGTFTSTGDNGIEIFEDSTSLTISGGTFTGLYSGLTINNNPTVKLSGGTFKATGEEAEAGAIRLTEGTTIDALLSSGYKYTTSSDSEEVSGIKVMSVKETSVISENTTNDESNNVTEVETTTETKKTTPQTGDNIVFFELMLVLSIISFVYTSLKKKKFN